HLQQQQQYVQLQQQHQSYFSLQHQQQQPQQQHLPSSSNSSEVAASGSGLGPADLQFDTLNNNNHSNGSSEQPTNGATDTQKRRSLLNFKSLDFHLKSLYSGLRSHSSAGTGASSSQPNSSAPAVDQVQRRMPYLRVESVDPEGETGLRRTRDGDGSDGTALSGHSPSFLSPYSGTGAGGAVSLQLPSADAATIRRSSTSDIVNCKKGASGGTGTGGAGAGAGAAGSAQDSRRPSTSDLLRRARERKGSEARMGRSVSHSGLTRGGAFGGGGGLGGRRTSMAF
ncbi:homeotic protein female sterile-like, partial [Drosophila serrata]|uniref:homeotic protein female sterile-like n=1 Tax=Drosophila serrata TaxID=7274 RepID=UPI000A1D1807